MPNLNWHETPYKYESYVLSVVPIINYNAIYLFFIFTNSNLPWLQECRAVLPWSFLVWPVQLVPLEFFLEGLGSVPHLQREAEGEVRHSIEPSENKISFDISSLMYSVQI
jgi:hypothetical protein